MAASRAGSSRAGSRRGRVPRLAPIAAVRGGVAMSASAELSAQDQLKQQVRAGWWSLATPPTPVRATRGSPGGGGAEAR